MGNYQLSSLEIKSLDKLPILKAICKTTHAWLLPSLAKQLNKQYHSLGYNRFIYSTEIVV